MRSMTEKMSKAGQALLDDVLAIKAGALTKVWTPEQLLVIFVRKQLEKTRSAFSRWQHSRETGGRNQ